MMLEHESFMHVVLKFLFFKQKTAYEVRISDWSSDVCSSDLVDDLGSFVQAGMENRQAAVAQAEAIIENRVQSFMHWVDARAMVPVIQDLHEAGELMRTMELDRARRLLAKGEDIETVLDALSKGLTAKFLHGSQQALNSAQGEER